MQPSHVWHNISADAAGPSIITSSKINMGITLIIFCKIWIMVKNHPLNNWVQTSLDFHFQALLGWRQLTLHDHWSLSESLQGCSKWKESIQPLIKKELKGSPLNIIGPKTSRRSFRIWMISGAEIKDNLYSAVRLRYDLVFVSKIGSWIVPRQSPWTPDLQSVTQVIWMSDFSTATNFAPRTFIHWVILFG